MEKPIAIDVALIPPPEILEWAVSLNRALGAQPNRIPLHAERCVPHVTLAMAVVPESALSALENETQALAESYAPLSLETTSPYRALTPAGEPIVGLGMSVPDRLRDLHRQAVALLREAAVPRFVPEALVDGEEADPLTLQFIRDFPQRSTHEKFFPHVTIGFGEMEQPLPRRFRVEDLSLYQLGDYCTCRRLIRSFRLSV